MPKNLNLISVSLSLILSGFLQTVGEISTFWRSTLMETTLDADMEIQTHYKSVTPAHHHLFSTSHQWVAIVYINSYVNESHVL